MTEGRARAERAPVPERARMLDEVMEGLARDPREIPPKFFYDARGSELFEEITGLPEYYPTRVERHLLARCAPQWIQRIRAAVLVEFGAGSARKSRILLDAMAEEGRAKLFVPVDVSAEFLEETARELRAEYPSLEVVPAVADITAPIRLPGLPSGPALFALLGGTIGNFENDEAVQLLRRIADAMRPDDAFLLGIDLRPGPLKSVEMLEAAYNDEQGITAAFNLNILEVLNDRLDSDFDPTAFAHRAFYDAARARIEMHLVSLRDQTVGIPGGGIIRLRKGESIRTEVSCKYDRGTLEAQLEPAGLRLEDWCEDLRARFALTLIRRCA